MLPVRPTASRGTTRTRGSGPGTISHPSARNSMRRGMQLFVDFIPNHTGFDHPWIGLHPDRYIQTTVDGFRRAPEEFRAIETVSKDVHYVACGRDPYFPPWQDVAQLDYSSPDTRGAMVAELARLAQRVDGVRCDMAMLVLSDVFRGTWKDHLTAAGAGPRVLERRATRGSVADLDGRGLLGSRMAAAGARFRLHLRQAPVRSAAARARRRGQRPSDRRRRLSAPIRPVHRKSRRRAQRACLRRSSEGGGGDGRHRPRPPVLLRRTV